MKTITVKTDMFQFKKRLMPRIEWILPDNEISLALESNLPIAPDETTKSDYSV